MKKYIVVLFVCLVGGIAFGQKAEIHAKLIDSVTKEAIEGVVISNDKENVITVSNDEGRFSVIENSTNVSLNLNHISYQSQQVIVPNNSTIELVPLHTELDEILVFKKPIHQVFATAMASLNKSVQKGDLYETYFREFNTINNKHTNMADGLVDFYVSKEGKRALVEVKQNRVFTSKTDIDKGNIDQYFNVIGLGDLRDVLNKLVLSSELTKILKSSTDYEFSAKIQKKASGKKVVVVEFVPKQSIKEELYYEGYIVFDESQSKVLEYRYSLASELKKNPKVKNILGLVKIGFHDQGQHAVFKQVESDYYVSYGKIFIDVDMMIKGEVDRNIVISREIIVDKVSRNVALPKQQSFKSKDLFGKESSYSNTYWLERSIRPLTTSEQRVLNELELK